MPGNNADLGYGTTITFSSGFCASVTSVSWSGISREAIDETDMISTNGAMEFFPSDLTDAGELEVEMHFDPDATPPITSAAETVTVTFPVPSGLTNGATWAATGFLTEFSADVPVDDKMTATATIKFSGEITYTDAS